METKINIQEAVNKAFKIFSEEYSFEDQREVWNKQSEYFHVFWSDKIMDSNYQLSQSDTDSLMRILDSKARGHQPSDQMVARIGIYQSQWEQFFSDLKKHEDLKASLNNIFNAQDDSQLISLIDRAREVNQDNNNGFNGDGANMLNALLFINNPKKFLSVLSLHHRSWIIETFGLGDISSYSTVGEKIVKSNEIIINGFRDKYGLNIEPRPLSVFLYTPHTTYSSRVKRLWYRDDIERKHRSRSTGVRINEFILEKYIDLFKKFVIEKNDYPGVSFSSGYLSEAEGYKHKIRENALEALKPEDWSESDIGTGKIVNFLINAIEIQDNNLVKYQAVYGEKQRPHNSLYEAKEDPGILKRYENLIYGFFKSDIQDEEAFDEFVELGGKHYPFIAYIYFLKNYKRYVPIAPTYFDKTFEKLGINFKTTRKCSWENYQQFCDIVAEIQQSLREEIDEDVSLLDTHSFLWILGRQMEEDDGVVLEPEQDIVVTELILGKLEPRKKRANKIDNRKPKIFDLPENIKQQKKLKRLGDKAEQLVFDAERKFLEEHGKPELAQKVKDVSANSSLGYDILSFTLEGKEKYIEVKSTVSDMGHNIFYISKNELEKSQSLEGYYIYFVFNLETKPKIRYVSAPDLEGGEYFELIPQQYMVRYSAE